MYPGSCPIRIAAMKKKPTAKTSALAHDIRSGNSCCCTCCMDRNPFQRSKNSKTPLRSVERRSDTAFMVLSSAQQHTGMDLTIVDEHMIRVGIIGSLSHRIGKLAIRLYQIADARVKDVRRRLGRGGIFSLECSNSMW